MDNLEILFVVWGFLIQIVLISHFALRRWMFNAYIARYGWIVYALSVPSVMVSILLMINGKVWWLWAAGVLYLIWAVYGYRLEYIRRVEWRTPIHWPVAGPYLTLYLATIMFYWWPVGRLSRPLWFVYAVLFLISTFLNVTSHRPKTVSPA